MKAPPESQADDAIWRALADATRRRILDLLRERPLTTGEVCAEFAVTRFAVMKHLAVLVDAGIVLVEWCGRERKNHLNPVPIQQIYRRWLRPFDAARGDAFLRLKEHLEQGGVASRGRARARKPKDPS